MSDPEKEIKCIYFLSGSDIPIVPAIDVYNLEAVNRLCITGELIPTFAFGDALGKPPGWGVISPEKGAGYFLQADQWHSVDRKTAEYLSDFNFESQSFKDFESTQKYLANREVDVKDHIHHREQLEKELEKIKEIALPQPFLNRLLFLINTQERALNRLKKEPTHYYKYALCPDETHVSIALQLGKIEVQGTCTTGNWRPQPALYIPSPVEWKSWKEEIASSSIVEEEDYEFINASPKAQFINLETAIRRACKDNKIFFRKVSPELPFRKTWNLCGNPPADI